MPTLSSTRLSKNLGQTSLFYYLGQDGIGQVVIWGKLESDWWGQVGLGQVDLGQINMLPFFTEG